MNFKPIFLVSILSLFLLPSCQEELEMLNENPNQPETVDSDVLLTSAIRSSMNTMVNESFLLGNNAAQLTAKTLRAEVDIYNWNAFPTVWEGLYESLANVAEVERLAIEAENANLEGVAIVLRSWMFSILTDAYGDIPYTQAMQGVSNGIYRPVYDAQSDIYTGAEGLLAELERAAGLLGTEGTIQGDIIFGGETVKWVRLCNSLRLRLLMHLSERIDVSADVADLVDNAELMQSNDDNALLEYLGSFPNEFPLLPLKLGDFDAVVMSESSVSVMEGYNDPRLMAYARPDNLDFENPEFDGAINGSENPDICDKSGSRLGLAYFNYPGHPTTSEHADGILMTYAEVEFLLAEAAMKGFTTADADTHYRNGIQASMDYYNVEYGVFGFTDFDDYYMNSGVAYDEPIDIWEQKWLALFFTGLEPYFEVRRWMYANDFDWDAIRFLTPTCENVNGDQLPIRFLYPGEEESLNSENYSAAISRLGGNTQNAQIWLMQ